MQQLSAPTVVVNNTVVAIEPNSCAYTEGFGEQSARTASAGGGSVETVYSNDVATNLSMVKFTLASTIPNIKLAREWKANGNENVVSLSAENTDGDFNRSVSEAGVTNDFEVALSADGVLEIEFHGKAAI